VSLVHNGPASDSLDEGIAFSILFRAAKSSGSQIFPDFLLWFRVLRILSRSAT
jgi:hypothetical protein